MRSDNSQKKIVLVLIALGMVAYLYQTRIQKMKEHGPISGSIRGYSPEQLDTYSDNLMRRFQTNWSL
jgi:hypothetical protein